MRFSRHTQRRTRREITASKTAQEEFKKRAPRRTRIDAEFFTCCSFLGPTWAQTSSRFPKRPQEHPRGGTKWSPRGPQDFRPPKRPGQHRKPTLGHHQFHRTKIGPARATSSTGNQLVQQLHRKTAWTSLGPPAAVTSAKTANKQHL